MCGVSGCNPAGNLLPIFGIDSFVVAHPARLQLHEKVLREHRCNFMAESLRLVGVYQSRVDFDNGNVLTPPLDV